MKKLIIVILLISCFICGCSHDMNRREIDEINFIHVLGIDYYGGEYILTAIYSSNQGADPEKGEPGDEEISRGRGNSPYEAFQDLKLKNKKTVSIANTGYFLIGEGAAEHGIDKCLNFLSMDETVKMESLIFITKDNEVSDFIAQSIENEQVVHEDLEAVEQKQKELVTRNDNTLVNILNEIESKTGSILIPYLISEKNTFLIQGYAVFDDLKLVDYLDSETSSGVNFIKGIIRAFPIYLKDDVSLSVSYSKCKLKSDLNNNRILIKILLDFETMIKEINTSNDIFSQEELRRLTVKQNNYVIDVMKKATNYSIYNKRDILQIERLLQNQHAKSFRDYQEKWDEAVAQIEYEFEVNSKISKSFIYSKDTD